MPRTIRDNARRHPLVAASGAVALGVLLTAVVGLLSVFGPGAPPDVGGTALGSTILATLAGVALLWLLVVARAVRGVVEYADTGDRATGIGFAFAVVEGAVALAMLAIGATAASLARGSGGSGASAELLAVGAYAVVTVGFVLALASLGRASVTLLGEP